MTDFSCIRAGSIQVSGTCVEKFRVAFGVGTLWTKTQEQSQAMFLEARVTGPEQLGIVAHELVESYP
ncbi:MAG: hypothetical protein Q9210_006102 [Variospora velana]